MPPPPVTLSRQQQSTSRAPRCHAIRSECEARDKSCTEPGCNRQKEQKKTSQRRTLRHTQTLGVSASVINQPRSFLRKLVASGSTASSLSLACQSGSGTRRDAFLGIKQRTTTKRRATNKRVSDVSRGKRHTCRQTVAHSRSNDDERQCPSEAEVIFFA